MKVVTLRDMMDSRVIKLNTYNILLPEMVAAGSCSITHKRYL